MYQNKLSVLVNDSAIFHGQFYSQTSLNYKDVDIETTAQWTESTESPESHVSLSHFSGECEKLINTNTDFESIYLVSQWRKNRQKSEVLNAINGKSKCFISV